MLTNILNKYILFLPGLAGGSRIFTSSVLAAAADFGVVSRNPTSLNGRALTTVITGRALHDMNNRI